jgi:NADH dehydrogenase
MSVKRIVVLGSGFAGLWSALGAARKIDELGLGPDQLRVTVVNRLPFHDIRVRNYEADLGPSRIPLEKLVGPAGVEQVIGEVVAVDTGARQVTVATGAGRRLLDYDRIVVAVGSRTAYPDIPGLAEHAFDIDTHDRAVELNTHLRSLPERHDRPGLLTVVVIGAGLTGIEAATEMPAKLTAALARTGSTLTPRIVRLPHVGSDMGEYARPVIEDALTALGIEARTGVTVTAVNAAGVTLDTGETIPAATVVWCGGFHANPLTATLPAERDSRGRLLVDEYLRVKGVDGVYAAGDAAAVMFGDDHGSVMSCQHSRPMGKIAGHNVVSDLAGAALLPLEIDWYVTVLDLGTQGSVYTRGWDRQVVATGQEAKRTKQHINTVRIYPPLTGNRTELLEAAAPSGHHPPPLLPIESG